MDTNIRTYRLAELAAVRQDAEGTPADHTYKPTLQISSTAGRTKHISVSWEEFERIAALLTGQDAATGTAGAHIEPDADLREALRELDAILEDYTDCMGGEQTGPYLSYSGYQKIEKIRAAIARATGGQS